MPLKSRLTAILAKIETTPGVDSVPTPEANAILLRGVPTLTPINQQTVDRSLLRGYFGGSEQIPVGEYAEVEFDVEFAGAGSAAGIPKWSDLVLAAAYAGVANGSTAYEHRPATNSLKSITLYCYVGNEVLHRITGAVGTFTADLSAGAIPSMRFRFMGFYNPPTDAVMGAADFTGWQTPIGARDSTVPTLTLHGVTKATLPYRRLTIDAGNNLVFRNLIGARNMLVTERAVTGSVELQYEAVATKAWLDVVSGVQTAALSVRAGTVAGNIVGIDAPKVQLVNPRFSDVDGITHISMDMRLLPVSGNDEIVISTR